MLLKDIISPRHHTSLNSLAFIVELLDRAELFTVL